MSVRASTCCWRRRGPAAEARSSSRGEPGIGKTALLTHAAAEAGGDADRARARRRDRDVAAVRRPRRPADAAHAAPGATCPSARRTRCEAPLPSARPAPPTGSPCSWAAFNLLCAAAGDAAAARARRRRALARRGLRARRSRSPPAGSAPTASRSSSRPASRATATSRPSRLRPLTADRVARRAREPRLRFRRLSTPRCATRRATRSRCSSSPARRTQASSSGTRPSSRRYARMAAALPDDCRRAVILLRRGPVDEPARDRPRPGRRRD